MQDDMRAWVDGWDEMPEADDELRCDDPEVTFRLALESIQRWGGRYRVSPAMRLRAIRAVVDAALSGESV